MNEANSQLLAAARTYVTDLFQHKVNPVFVFHSLEHTEDVVEACSRIADYSQLEEEDRLVLLLAAWFHDTGYAAGQAEGHEDVSVQTATQFLHSKTINESLVQRVASCIQATRMPQSPVTLVEKILCDADLYHLATGDFMARNSLLKKERESLLGHKIDKKEWRKNNVQFLAQHHYFTDYGREALAQKKAENLAALQKKKPQKKKPEAEAKEQAFPFVTDAVKSTRPDKETERGVQTMFRTTSHNHLQLSGMADSKAHIMITVNSIILSVGVSYLLPRIQYPGNDYYVVPTAILMLTCLVSVTCSILATRPSINRGMFTEEDIRNKKTNLLFFGNFHKMGLNDYQWGMNQMLKDREYLYNTMIMDIYFLGLVLAKKYRYLRIAYTVFMVGLIIAVIAFGVAALLPDAASSAAPQTNGIIDY